MSDPWRRETWQPSQDWRNFDSCPTFHHEWLFMVLLRLLMCYFFLYHNNKLFIFQVTCSHRYYSKNPWIWSPITLWGHSGDFTRSNTKWNPTPIALGGILLIRLHNHGYLFVMPWDISTNITWANITWSWHYLWYNHQGHSLQILLLEECQGTLWNVIFVRHGQLETRPLKDCIIAMSVRMVIYYVSPADFHLFRFQSPFYNMTCMGNRGW